MNISTPHTENDFFTVTYRMVLPENSAPEIFARSIAEEQTVEIPHESIPLALIENGIVGKVLEVKEQAKGIYNTVIRYRCDVSGYTIPQFLNVLFGNISLIKNVRIINMSLSGGFISRFPGPRFGCDGVRQHLGIYHRPLLCTALKPMGTSCEELAAIAGACAEGGIDLIKDDHGIADQPFHRFEERVDRVIEAITKANLTNGNTTLYFPNVCGTIDAIDRQAQHAAQSGVCGVLLSPHLAGLDTARYIAEKYNLMIMAHPAFTGSLFTSPHQGIAPQLYLGILFRMLGADISIFPSWGGRFSFSRDTCVAIAKNLTRAYPPLKSAFPGPAGGITLERFKELAETYGEDAVYLVGGALLGHSQDIRKNTQLFSDTLKSNFNEKRVAPVAPFSGSCEVAAPHSKCDPPESGKLSFDYFSWTERKHELYKAAGSAVFTGITRTELIGKTGTNTAFDLRYFEIEAGGYSTFEKHQHEHVIIGVRGSGTLLKNGKQITIQPHDIGYIGPNEPHQLQNLTVDPFGFYCIVDHKRDRPQEVAIDEE